MKLEYNDILDWLKTTDPVQLETLWTEADRVRREQVGDEVFLRGLIELGNVCRRDCLYCGIRVSNVDLERYELSEEDIFASAQRAVDAGYETIVLQSGESPRFNLDQMAKVVRRLKDEFKVVVTLSLGELEPDEYAALRDAGSDRYLLRFETSDQELFNRIHPPAPGQKPYNRIEGLKVLRKIGFEVGSGVMIGIPGQTFESLARDVELFRELDLDMIGCGPFIPHPDTPLGREYDTLQQQLANGTADPNQPLADELGTYKVYALGRLLCPGSNIPATTALGTLNPDKGREYGLKRGANVLMPNVSPIEHRSEYEIYPDKLSLSDEMHNGTSPLREMLRSIDRTVGLGRGDSPNVINRNQTIN